MNSWSTQRPADLRVPRRRRSGLASMAHIAVPAAPPSTYGMSIRPSALTNESRFCVIIIAGSGSTREVGHSARLRRWARTLRALTRRPRHRTTCAAAHPPALRARRFLVAVCAAGVATGIVVPAASAGSSQFAAGIYVYAGEIFASTSPNAHTTDAVSGSSNHTWCPAASQGVTGYSYSWSYLSYGVCGPGYQSQSFCNCIYTRGTVYNPNAATTDYIYYANWYW